MGLRKRVLFLIESLGGGGAEKVLTTVISNIDQSKYDITLCAIVDNGKDIDVVSPFCNFIPILPNPSKLSPIGRIWHAIKYKLIYNILPMKVVYNLFIPKNNDVEIAFCEGFATKLLASSTNSKAQKIAWVHIDLKYNPWTQKVGIFRNILEEKQAYNRYDNIITVSETVMMSFNEIYELPNKTSTIYNPIDTKLIIANSIKSNPCFGKDVLNIITAGRLVDQKGYDTLLKVVLRLKNDRLAFKLRILGEGEQRTLLSDFIATNDLNNYVELLGYQSNPYIYIANSDLFVCSSRSEGYSLVIAEALVLSIPVISTYTSGPNELLDEGKYGMLVGNDESGEPLYEGLKRLISSPELLSNYKQKASSRGRAFSLEKTMTEIQSIL